MNSVLQTPSFSKLQPRTVQRSEIQVSELIAQIQAGAHQRCAGCLRWVARNGIGSVAVCVPDGDGAPIAYVLCRKCAHAIIHEEAQRATIIEHIEAYLQGGAR